MSQYSIVIIFHSLSFRSFFSSTGISSVLFQSRIGCLDPVVPKETELFIQSIKKMFVMTLLTMAMPKWLHQLFPKPWNIFCQCWDNMFDFGALFECGNVIHYCEIHLRNHFTWVL